MRDTFIWIALQIQRDIFIAIRAKSLFSKWQFNYETSYPHGCNSENKLMCLLLRKRKKNSSVIKKNVWKLCYKLLVFLLWELRPGDKSSSMTKDQLRTWAIFRPNLGALKQPLRKKTITRSTVTTALSAHRDSLIISFWYRNKSAFGNLNYVWWGRVRIAIAIEWGINPGASSEPFAILDYWQSILLSFIKRSEWYPPG